MYMDRGNGSLVNREPGIRATEEYRPLQEIIEEEEGEYLHLHQRQDQQSEVPSAPPMEYLAPNQREELIRRGLL
jgi:hypothetical protein